MSGSVVYGGFLGRPPAAVAETTTRWNAEGAFFTSYAMLLHELGIVLGATMLEGIEALLFFVLFVCYKYIKDVSRACLCL